jgi:RNA polymerase sigma factor (sigma-70 family)
MSSSIPIRLLQTQSDSRLVELAEGGSERAFEALVNRYRKPLLGYCRRLLLPEARAEDALQQGLLQAWLALRSGAEVRDAKAWLYRIVHNASVSALRRSGYDYVELDESLHGARASEEDLDRRIAVREALAGLAALPDGQREVLLRTALQGDSHVQVAAAMGLSEGAVRGLVYRARASLRTAVTALTPPPLLLWASRAAETGGAHPQLAELVTAGGSAGLFGALLKGGAVLVSVSAIATGATLVEHHDSPASTARADTISARTPAPFGSQSIRAGFAADGGTQLAFSHDHAERSHQREHAGRDGRGRGDHGHRPGVADDRSHGDSTGSAGSGAALDGSRSGSSGSGGDSGSGSGSSGSTDGASTGDSHGSVPLSSSEASTSGGGSRGGTSGSDDPTVAPAAAPEEPTPLPAPTEVSSGGSRQGGDSTSLLTGGDGSSSGSGSGH